MDKYKGQGMGTAREDTRKDGKEVITNTRDDTYMGDIKRNRNMADRVPGELPEIDASAKSAEFRREQIGKKDNTDMPLFRPIPEFRITKVFYYLFPE